MYQFEEDVNIEGIPSLSGRSSSSDETKNIDDNAQVREEKPQDDKNTDNDKDKDTTPDIGKFITPSELSDLTSIEDTEEDYRSSAKYKSPTSERTPPVFKEVTPEQREQRLLKLMEELNKGDRYFCRKFTEKLD